MKYPVLIIAFGAVMLFISCGFTHVIIARIVVSVMKRVVTMKWVQQYGDRGLGDCKTIADEGINAVWTSHMARRSLMHASRHYLPDAIR